MGLSSPSKTKTGTHGNITRLIPRYAVIVYGYASSFLRKYIHRHPKPLNLRKSKSVTPMIRNAKAYSILYRGCLLYTSDAADE